MSKNKRFYYSTVGYGVFTLVGEVYRIGRVELWDRQGDGYAIGESTYWVPHSSAREFEDFWDNFETDFPIQMGGLWNDGFCNSLVADHLGITVEQLDDKDFIKEYYKEKYKENETEV